MKHQWRANTQHISGVICCKAYESSQNSLTIFLRPDTKITSYSHHILMEHGIKKCTPIWAALLRSEVSCNQHRFPGLAWEHTSNYCISGAIIFFRALSSVITTNLRCHPQVNCRVQSDIGCVEILQKNFNQLPISSSTNS